MERSKYLGGGDIAALCGENQWRGEYEVWLSKTNPAYKPPVNASCEWGIRAEEMVAKKFAEVHAVNIIPGRFIQHPTISFIGGTPDYIYEEADGAQGVLEVKNTEIFNLNKWSPGVWGEGGECPNGYYLQVQYYLMLTGLTFAYIAVLIGKDNYQEVKIVANPKMHKNLLTIACNFWHTYVESKTPPPAEMKAETIAMVYGKDDGSTKQIAKPPSFIELLKQKEAEIKTIESEVEAMKNEIKQALGESTFGLIDNRFLVEWKTVNRKGYEVKPTSYRQFRIKEIGTKLVEA